MQIESIREVYFKDSEKYSGEYHDLCVQNDTLFLADVFENVQICVLKYMNSTLLVFSLHQD